MTEQKTVLIKNGLKKPYVVYKSIIPEFSAVHTKLCADNLILDQHMLFFLGKGYVRCLEDGKLQLFNPTFLNDLCGNLGIYLEEFQYYDEQLFFEEVRKNSIINIAPPMIYVIYKGKEYLTIVCKVHEDHTYDVISAVDKEVINIGKDQIDYSKPWYMMNSPRFMNPVFRPIQEMIKCAAYGMFQIDYQLYENDYQSYFSNNDQTIARAIAEYDGKFDKEFQVFFIDALKCMCMQKKYYHMLDLYKFLLVEQWNELNCTYRKDTRYLYAQEILKKEKEIWGFLKEMMAERKGYA